MTASFTTRLIKENANNEEAMGFIRKHLLTLDKVGKEHHDERGNVKPAAPDWRANAKGSSQKYEENVRSLVKRLNQYWNDSDQREDGIAVLSSNPPKYYGALNILMSDEEFTTDMFDELEDITRGR